MRTCDILEVAVMAVFLISCDAEGNTSPGPTDELVEIIVNTSYTIEEEPMYAPTRALSAVQSNATRISLKVFDGDGNVAFEDTQRKDEEDFGSFTAIRLAPGTYTFVAVGHQATSTSAGDAIIESPTSATIPDEYLRDVYSCTKDVTVVRGSFQPQSVTLTLPLCVTRLRILLNDRVPQGIAEVGMTVNSGKDAFSSFTFDPSTGFFEGDRSFTRRWKIPAEKIGTTGMSFSPYVMLNRYPLSVSASITAYDTEGEVYASREFTGIPLKKGVMTTVSTNLFSSGTDATLEFEEWGQEEVIEVP